MSEHQSLPFFPEQYIPGWLEVYAGPMRSGKSSEIRNRFSKLEPAGLGYKRFQPSLNERDSGNGITTRNGDTFEAIKIVQPYEVFDYLKEGIPQDGVHVVGFDEAQFFPDSIEQVVEGLLLQDRNVVVAGLDLDSEKETFGSMGRLMELADYVKKLHAVCEGCGDRPARYTYFKGGKKDQVLVGDEVYDVLCRGCYDSRSG
ncbi:MAG: thymidine kinase [Candidatus Woesearchaeota archaeon]